ncbi:PCI domain-containing protein 2 homolog [Drosophila serrata]|uniref:PCI domain-containing protein 2 homolog n=1 Tax=Drosophila serrata TaxID=7274 RepID=UPI000A1D28D3|nr:PCI domain-containing protein 2 homolog [Drosophila serrata]
MFENVEKYLTSVQEATIGNKSQVVGSFVSLRDNHVKNTSLYIAQPEEFIKKVGLMKPLDEVISAHLKVMYNLTLKPPNYIGAYVQQDLACKMVGRLVEELKYEDWCLALMYRLCLDLRVLAKMCEKRCPGMRPGQKRAEAADSIMGCFRICTKGPETTKHLSMIFMVNQLFKIYFRINKSALCTPLIKAIENCNAKDSFPMQEQITYNYFMGIRAMFDSQYPEAVKKFSFAFIKCPDRFTTNKRLILYYLVVVKMLLGYLPSKSGLERNKLMFFYELTMALKSGNVGKFDEFVKKRALFLIRSGIYLAVQKLKNIVYRSLFKKVFIIRKSHELEMSEFQEALKFVGVKDVKLDQVHCIVANLICEGKINGKITGNQKLVISEQDPFPALISK